MALPAVISSEQALLEVSTDGSTFDEVPGVSSFSLSGGDPETRQTIMFRGTRQKAGAAQAPTVDVELASFLPHHAAMRTLQDRFKDGEKVRIRLTTLEDEIFASTAGSTCAIATTGVCTFVGTGNPDFTGDDYGPGFVIEVGGTKYVIDGITNAGVMTVDPAPASAVSAAIYKIYIPSVRLGGSTGLLVGVGAPGANLASQADLGSTIQFFPDRPLASTDWSVV